MRIGLCFVELPMITGLDYLNAKTINGFGLSQIGRNIVHMESRYKETLIREFYRYIRSTCRSDTDR